MSDYMSNFIYKAESLKEAAEILNKVEVKFSKIVTHAGTIFFYFLNERNNKVAEWSHEFGVIIEPIPVYLDREKLLLYKETKFV